MGKEITCGDCGSLAIHYGHGLCASCYNQRWKNANKKRIRELENARYPLIAKRKNQRRRELYALNRDDVIAKKKKWRAENPGKIKEIKRRFYANHREQIIEYVQLRRTMANAERRSFSFEAICERDLWKCHICGNSVDQTLKFPARGSATRDHVIPVSQGGAHVPENIRLAHFGCNSGRRDRGGNEQLLLIGD